MKITTATRVAALAVGLSFAGAQAFAADQPNGRGNNDRSTSQHQDQNDQGNRDERKKKAKNPKIMGDGNRGGNPIVLRSRTNGNDQGKVVLQRRNANHANDNRRSRTKMVNDRRNQNTIIRTNDQQRNWGNQDRRRTFDVARFQRNFNAPRRYRAARYQQPYGYSYRRYSYGQYLPASYFVQRFLLSNFLGYGLFEPPQGLIWVRYGPDALLIDRYTGEVIQVQYDVFYS